MGPGPGWSTATSVSAAVASSMLSTVSNKVDGPAAAIEWSKLELQVREDVQGVMHNTPTEQRKYGCPLPCKLPPWEDPRINQKRRESPHATVYPFESEHLSIGHALDTASLGASSRVVMLSGSERAWSFFFSGEIHKRPSVRSAPAANVPFQSPSFNDTSWHRISVPSNWEMVGFGVPLYVNSTR